MNNFCKFLFSNLIWLSVQANAQSDKSIRTDRPGQAIVPYTVGKNNFQSQTGFYIGGINYYNDEDYFQYRSGNTFLKYGLSERFELNAALGYRKDWVSNFYNSYTYDGIYDFSFGMRINIINGKGYDPSLGFQYSGNIPVSKNNIYVSQYIPKVLLSGMQKISDRFNLTVNLGAVKNPFSRSYSGLYVLNLGYAVSPEMSVFIENYGNFDKYGIYQKWDTGLAYLVNDNLQLDMYGGIGPASYGYSYFAGAGASWRLLSDKK